MSDDLSYLPPVSRETWETYKYRNNVPLRGLQIDGRPALTGIDPSKIGDYVFVFVRDPLCAYDDDPATQLASRLENAELAGKTGMFTTWTGTYKSARISAISGGSGGPEAELCMFELLEYTDASTFLRVGGSGGTNEAVRPGDLVIAKGIVRDEGLSAAYVGAGWPAVCDADVVIALAEAARARFPLSHRADALRRFRPDLRRPPFGSRLSSPGESSRRRRVPPDGRAERRARGFGDRDDGNAFRQTRRIDLLGRRQHRDRRKVRSWSGPQCGHRRRAGRHGDPRADGRRACGSWRDTLASLDAKPSLNQRLP